MQVSRRLQPWIPFLTLGLVLLGWVFAGAPASAQTVEVDSADPPGAEQGTVNLDVTIKGNGFGRDSQVEFLVTGTTETGGIIVNSVRSKGQKTLVANIDVDAEAVVGDFDIQVTTAGRTGKGTELFAVSQKSGGGAPDTTAPGAVDNLSAGSVGFSTIEVTWSETADDGYDPSSGTVDLYRFYSRTDGPVTEENLASTEQVANGAMFGVVPEGSLSLLLCCLEPETTYYIAATAEDVAGNVSLVSNNVIVSTTAFPATSWATEEIDRCPTNEGSLTGATSAVDYDANGDPALLYSYVCNESGDDSRLAEWNGAGFASSSTGLAISHRQAFAFDPLSGEATMTSDGWGRLDFYRRVGTGWVGEVIERNNVFYGALAYDPLGAPAIAYKKGAKGKGSPTCNLARWDGAGWAIEIVDPDSDCRNPRLAFDSLRQPAITYRYDPGGTGLGVKFAHWTGVGWSRETVHVPPTGWSDSAPTLAFDPGSGTFSVAFVAQRSSSSSSRTEPLAEVQFCRWASGSWSCEVVDQAGYAWETDLAYDASGTAYLAYVLLDTVQVAVRPAGTTEWAVEVVDWGHGIGNLSLTVDPNGTAAIAYQVQRDDKVTESFRFARRSSP